MNYTRHLMYLGSVHVGYDWLCIAEGKIHEYYINRNCVIYNNIIIQFLCPLTDVRISPTSLNLKRKKKIFLTRF